MRFGQLTCKQVAQSCGVSETKASQAWDPAVLKVALIILNHPREAISEIEGAMSHILQVREHAKLLRQQKEQTQARRQID